MKKLLSTFVKYPFYGKIFIFTIILSGIVALLSLTMASFPVVEARTLSVSVSYQGATPKEMEEGVVSLLENAIVGVVGIKEHSSVSQENSAVLSITIDYGYNIDDVVADVKNAIDGISNFPSGAEQPVISKGRTTTPAMFLALTSKSGDLIKMQTEAIRISDEWRGSGVISQVSQSGTPTRLEMSIEIDENAMTEYGITLSQINSAIANYNIDSYGGLIKSPSEQIKINVRNRSVNPRDIEQIIVRASADGSQVRVEDIAKVVYQFEDSPKTSYLNGERNVFIQVSNLKEEDLRETTEYVESYIEKYNNSQNDMKLSVVRSFLDTLNGQLNILYSNGIMGVLLVIIVLSLFLNFRISLWVAWGIPASFLGMFVVGYLTGISLNMISLFGMILIIGILVDDGIVVGENIYTYFEKGHSPKVAAIKGTMEVLPSVITSVLTTIVAFIPLLVIEGSLEMMYEMAIVVIACLTFSVIEVMFILPGHLASKSVLKPTKGSWYAKVRNGAERGINWCCNKLYIPYLKWTLGKKSIVIAAVSAMILITVGLAVGGRISFSFFPPSNEDNFNLDLALKPGTPTEQVITILDDIEIQIREIDQQLAAEYGEEPFIENCLKQTGSAFSGNESGEHAGTVRVFLRNLNESQVSSDVIKMAISQNMRPIPNAYKFTVGASSRFGAPVSISLFSGNSESLEEASEDLKVELAKLSALYNIMDNNQLGSREVHLELKPLAYSLSLTPSEIMAQVRSAFYGSLVQRIQEGRNEIWFYIRYPESNSKDLGDLESLIIRTSNGGEYPIRELCNYTIERGVTKINHFNGQKEICVDAYMLDPDESIMPILEEVSATIMPNILAKYPDVTYMYQGQIKDSNENLEKIVVSFGLAFVVMMLILVIYFRSFVQGVLIMSMVPISFMAAVWGHLLEGAMLSMMSIWGMVALSGTIINNAVVFMARYNTLLKSGKTVIESIIETGRSRFRPIMLTSITTIAGLFPLIKETSSEASFVQPMAISLGYGILIGTMFILAIFPALIKSVNFLSLMKARLLGDKNATAESVENAIIDAKINATIDKEMEESNSEII